MLNWCFVLLSIKMPSYGKDSQRLELLNSSLFLDLTNKSKYYKTQSIRPSCNITPTTLSGLHIQDWHHLSLVTISICLWSTLEAHKRLYQKANIAGLATKAISKRYGGVENTKQIRPKK